MDISQECQEQVEVSYSLYFEKAISVRCGKPWAGVLQLCEKHQEEMKKRYPQGWAYYPGDICPHGTYVGGLGPDYMCGQCEQGE